MPELPEVETIRRGLEENLLGLKIIDIQVLLPRIFLGDKAAILETEITGVERFGKGLVINFDNQYSLAIHVKMTGQLIYEAREKRRKVVGVSKGKRSSKVMGKLPNKYTHVIFHLLKTKGHPLNATLFYNDIRQFGWLKVVKTTELKNMSYFHNLGPEPLKDLDLRKFKIILKSSKGTIKPLLMEQTKIGGIGNIYANDALWMSKINPKRKANCLTEDETDALFHAIEAVLQKSISLGGASETNFVNALGQEGEYQKHFLVYGQNGKACKRCGVKIIRDVVGGRGTFYCSVCQI